MEGGQHVPGQIVPFCVDPPRDAAIASLADRQHGPISLPQLKAFGLTASGVRKRVRRGQLHRIHQGVYSVGIRKLTREGVWMAAVLACGRGAVLSHRSAAALWGIGRDAANKTHVSVPSRSVRRRSGIEVHAAASLMKADVTECEGIPCTTVARTIIDVAGFASQREVERAINEAEVLRVFDRWAMEGALARANGVAGAGLVRSVLEGWSDPAMTESELEQRVLVLCRDAGVEEPEVNAWVALEGGAVKVDFLWREQRLVVETDGHTFHRTPAAFERDRERDQRLAAAGYRVVRFTWRQVVGAPARVARTIQSLLAR